MTKINKVVQMVVVALIAVLMSGSVFAMNFNSNLTKNIKSGNPEAIVQNLTMGLNSDCSGLKKSCIYLAGFHGIEGMVEPLVNQLTKETDPSIRVLIALALYKIGTPEAIKAIEKLVKNDLDPKVKKMGIVILNDFQTNFPNLNVTKK